MRRIAGLAAACSPLLAAGCGGSGGDSYANKLRPPSPIVLGASINKDRVTVSPSRFGAGPVDLIITNQTDAAQEITFETAGSGAGIRQQTGPINPQDTATLQANLKPGKVTVRVRGDGIAPAQLTVGAKRPSAQDDLLQP